MKVGYSDKNSLCFLAPFGFIAYIICFMMPYTEDEGMKEMIVEENDPNMIEMEDFDTIKWNDEIL